ncbi:hypothetical protein N1851_005951 [Merluccius polli]|uniref:THAP-type domain-containing protein n=1 Tax=Merluccius polli TaxID=89951 RepID=A0AA47P8T6_MERPO|nr:hypothetical protein N1851_005951 [Merluccius polli]
MVGQYCCVRNCHSKSHDSCGRKLGNGISFYGFPTWKRNEGELVEKVTTRRRMAWIAAVRRNNIKFSNISASMKVCSLHFQSGQPAYEMLETHPDWAPSLHLGHADAAASSARRSKRAQRRKNPLQAAEMTRAHRAGGRGQLHSEEGAHRAGGRGQLHSEEGAHRAGGRGQLHSEEGAHRAGGRGQLHSEEGAHRAGGRGQLHSEEGAHRAGGRGQLHSEGRWVEAIRRDEGPAFTVPSGRNIGKQRLPAFEQPGARLGGGDVGAVCEEEVEEEKEEAEEEAEEEEEMPSGCSSGSAPDHDYAKPPSSAEGPSGRIQELELKNQLLQRQLQQLTLEMSRFWATDEEQDDVGFHSRFPNEEVFKLFWESFSPAASKRPYWSKAQTRIATRDAACQTDSSAVLEPSRRSKDPGVYCSTDGQEVAGPRLAKRRRRCDGSPPRPPPTDDITDWNASDQGLWSGPDVHITDSPSSQVPEQADTEAWVKVTVKDEDEEEVISWGGGDRREENEEQEDRKPPASPLSQASTRSETSSPGPGGLSPGEAGVKEEKEVTVKEEETHVVGEPLVPPGARRCEWTGDGGEVELWELGS